MSEPAPPRPKNSPPADRIELEEVLREHSDLATSLSSAATPHQAARICVASAMRAAGIDIAGVYLFDDDTGELVLAAVGGAGAGFVAEQSRYPANAPRVQWLRGHANRLQRVLELPIQAIEDPSLLREGVSAIAVAPFRYQGQVFGCLNVASREHRSLSPAARESVELVATLTGEALSRLDAERRVRQSEGRLRSLFETMSQGVIYQDRSGRIIQANPAAYRILGLTNDELFRSVPLDPAWRLVKEDGAAFAPDEYPFHVALLTAQPVRNVLAGVCNPLFEETRWILIDSFPEFDERKSYPTRVHSVFSDITEQRAAERSQREHQEQYRSMVGASLDGFVVIDAQGRILEANDAYCRMIGYTAVELRQVSLSELDGETAPAVVAEHFTKVRLQGYSRFEATQRRSDGLLLEVEVSAWLVPGQQRMLGFVRDLTAIKSAERTQAQQERRYEAILRGAMDGFLVVDPVGRLTEVNDALCVMLGYSREALLGMSLGELDANAGHANAERVLSRIRARRSARFETVLCASGGQLVDTEVSAWVLPGSETVLAFVRDFTARRRADEELRKSEAQLRQAQKMEAVGRLAGGIAHDFNNLLTVINATADMALAELQDHDGLRDDLVEIKEAGVRAAGLTRQLLTFSRRQVIQPRVLNLNTVVTDLQRMLHRLIGEDVTLRVQLSARAPHLLADPGQIEQVVLNLAVNARDAMPDGGTMTIETNSAVFAADSLDRPLSVPTGRFVVLSVGDTGCGMDDDTLAQAFEPFFTTKGHNGTGLGLATVFGIVKQSDGHIVVKSSPGRGTRFDLYFPQTSATTPNPAERPAPGAATGGETILVVEDERGVRQVVQTILEAVGYKVLTAASGEEGVALCSAHRGAIQLALTDLVMPKMSGREFAERARALCPAMKVIYCSGYSGEVLSRQGVLDPGVHFVTKPFDVETLRRKVRSVLDDESGPPVDPPLP